MAVHLFLQSYAPQWRRSPLIAACQSAHVVVVKSHAHCLAAHVVQQKVAVGVDGLAAEPWYVGTVEQCGSAWFGVQRGHVAQLAFCLVEHLLAFLHHWVDGVASCRHAEAVQVEVNVLHVFGADVELVVGQPHHASLCHLALSFAYLFRIAAVGGAHVARESQFHCQVGVLRLVA